MMQIPNSAEELIKDLDREFPHKCPDMDWPDRKIWFEAGARWLVDYLLASLEDTQQEQFTRAQYPD